MNEPQTENKLNTIAAQEFDIVVIGSGPAGESAAMNAVKAGSRVAMICDKPGAGGNCTYLGTIPSKALRHSVKQVMQLTGNRVLRDLAEVRKLSFTDIISHAYRVIGEQSNLREDKYERNNVPIFYGTGSFIDKNTLEVQLEKKRIVLKAAHFIVTTGSRPYQPDDVDFTHPRVFDSDSILGLAESPHKITIIGAGVIGCEYASIFAGLGVKVELINPASNLLSFLDKEISDALSYHLQNMGVRSRHLESFDFMEYHDDCIVTYLESGKRIKSDVVLWANGRTGNTDRLNLEAIGLEANSRGQLVVNERYQTTVENIYAAGDVIGWPSLASAAYDQGRAASNAIVNPAAFMHVDEVPTGIYTIPEISTVGKNEEELTKEKIPYEVGKAFFRTIARAEITGEDTGMLKIIFHVETLEILGIHCFGDQASEIIHIGQAIMNQKNGGNTLNYFIDTTFNYPTMAEAYKMAALDGINRIF